MITNFLITQLEVCETYCKGHEILFKLILYELEKKF